MTSALEKIITRIAPHHCISCSIEDNILCDGCISSMPQFIDEQCVVCHQRARQAICRQCTASTGIQAIWIAQSYEGTVKQLIWQYKFERVKEAAKPLANLLQNAVPHLQHCIVTNVPTIPAHIRQRGYDHAELLAKSYARQVGLPYIALLERRSTLQQKGRNRSERLYQAKDAFYKRPAAKVEGVTALLIDDVITTGATVQAAARALHEAKADRVVIAAVAWHGAVSRPPY